MINQSKLFQTKQRNLKSDISRKMGKTHRVKKKCHWMSKTPFEAKCRCLWLQAIKKIRLDWWNWGDYLSINAWI